LNIILQCNSNCTNTAKYANPADISSRMLGPNFSLPEDMSNAVNIQKCANPTNIGLRMLRLYLGLPYNMSDAVEKICNSPNNEFG
jgi:hypothetical protein